MFVTDSFLAYTLTATLLTLTPGLGTALILRTTTAEGGRKALHAVLGVDLGCFIWGALVTFGLGTLLAVSELAYTLLRWCGTGYLRWLGIRLLLRPRQQFDGNPAKATATSDWFLRGMLGDVLNPKMDFFYVSFSPQFTPTGHSPASWAFLLVTIHVLIGTLWSLTLVTATRYAAGIPRKPAVVKQMDRTTGCLFLVFATKLAISRRQSHRGMCPCISCLYRLCYH